MTHPEELLADYVDGALTDDERAAADAHLATCETCREEIELARQAVTALASLEEESVPFGVMNPVTDMWQPSHFPSTTLAMPVLPVFLATAS